MRRARIWDTTAQADWLAETEVCAALSQFAGPRVHLLGNHDVEKLDARDNEALMGVPVHSRIVDLGLKTDARIGHALFPADMG